MMRECGQTGPGGGGPRRTIDFRRCLPLLPYCLGLIVFALLAALHLPGLKDVAAALGAAEAVEALEQAAAGPFGDLIVNSGKLSGVLPELSALAGLILLGKISQAVAALLLLLNLAGARAPFLLRPALWLGLAHALFAALLLGRAAWALWRAPLFFLEFLTAPLQNFAGGGAGLWLAGLAGLLALLELARRQMNRAGV